jgi:hypothetical protein
MAKGRAAGRFCPLIVMHDPAYFKASTGSQTGDLVTGTTVPRESEAEWQED